MRRRDAIRVVWAMGLLAVLTAFALGGVLWLIGTLPIVFFACAAILYWILSAGEWYKARRRVSKRSDRR